MAYQGRGGHTFAGMAQSLTPGGVGGDNWVGGQDGNGDWNSGADWSAGVPASSATATFATGLFTGYTVTGDATIAGILVDGDQVTFDGAITQDSTGGATFLSATNGAAVTLDANAFVSGQGLSFDSGTLLDVQGLLITTGGTADQVIVEGLTGQMITSGDLQVNGLYVQTGASYAGNVTLSDGGNITVDTSSLFGGGTITLLGSGLFYDAAASGQTTGTTGLADAIALGAAGTVLNLAADPGVTLTVSGPISGGGAVLISGGTVELAAVNAYTGGTVVQNATLNVDGVGTVGTGAIFVENGTVNLGTDSTGLGYYGDTIVATAGSNTVNAAFGTQLVFAGPGADLTFTGGTASSTVVGGSGVLVATGGSAGDLIWGGTSGADRLYTGAGNATVVGASGAFVFANGAGNVELAANGDGVTLNALAATGNATLFGGTGNTTIVGGGGTDIAALGGGATNLYASHGTVDVFVNSSVLALDYVVGAASGGTTNVIGFNLSTSQIDLFGYGSGAADQLLASETITGGNTILQFSDQATLVLYGVTGLTSANFSTVG